MAKIFNNIISYKSDPTKFGGLIYPQDFNTNYVENSFIKGSSIAYRIKKDRKFDEQCRKNIELRNRRF